MLFKERDDSLFQNNYAKQSLSLGSKLECSDQVECAVDVGSIYCMTNHEFVVTACVNL